MVELKQIPLPIRENDERLKENTTYLIRAIRSDIKLTPQWEVGIFQKDYNKQWVLHASPEELVINNIHELYEIVEPSSKKPAAPKSELEEQLGL